MIVGDFEDGFIDENDKLKEKIEEYEGKERDRSITNGEFLRCENNKLKEKIKELQGLLNQSEERNEELCVRNRGLQVLNDDLKYNNEYLRGELQTHERFSDCMISNYVRLSFYHDNFEYHRYDNYKFDPYNSIKNCKGFIVDSRELKYDRCLPYFMDDIVDNVDYQIKKIIFVDNMHYYINQYLEDHIYRKLGQSQVLGMYFEALVKTMFVNEDVHCIECPATDRWCMPVKNNMKWCDVFVRIV